MEIQPNCGSRMVERSQHIIVQRRHVRQSLQKVNPEEIERELYTEELTMLDLLIHCGTLTAFTSSRIVIHREIDRFSPDIAHVHMIHARVFTRKAFMKLHTCTYTIVYL